MRAAAHGELVNQTVLRFAESGKARGTVYDLADKPMEEWSEKELQAAIVVAVEFSNLGFLIKNGYVSKRAFMDLWAIRCVRLYVAVKPFIDWERSRFNSPQQYIYFEWLARSAFRRVTKRKRKLWWNRRSWYRLQRSTEPLTDLRNGDER
jgi:hypothetical protein